MSFTFRPAKRENVGLLLGFAGGTGSGKTFTALEVAAGIAGDKPFVVIDTEARRALHYADRFRFDHGDLRAPFTPEAYTDAIVAADAAGYPVIVVDSASHEWAGEGGLLDWHEEELEAIVARKREFSESKGWQFDEWKTREANNISAWIRPKGAHKAFVQLLLQLRSHLILCFRAEEKIEIGKDDRGKTEVRPKETPTGRDGWVPICEKKLPFELTCSFLLKAERPGFGIPIKLQEQHRPFFPADRPIGRAAGEAIARWAAGGDAAATSTGSPPTKKEPPTMASALLAIEASKTEADMRSAWAAVKQLGGEDRAEATTAWEKRRDELGLKRNQSPASAG